MKIHLKFLLIFLLSGFFVISCTTTTSITDLPENEGYEEIKRMYSKKNWESVSKDVNEFRVRYPYSQHTAELQLLQANSFYYSRQFLTAAVTYEDFIRRNPNSPEVEFAYFRIAESYDHDSLPDDDRDQENTEKAVEKYKEFLAKYPKSENYSERAEQRLAVLVRRMADHSLFVATFYWNKRLYASALMRYLSLIEKYPQFDDIMKTAHSNGAFCYNQLADMLEKHPNSEEYIFFRGETPQGLREKAKIMEQSS